MKRLLRNICIVFCVGLILIPLYLDSRTPDTNRLSDNDLDALTVTVADLGKADAILLQSGEHAMLIDAGYEKSSDELLEPLCFGKPLKTFGLFQLVRGKNIVVPIYHALSAHEKSAAEIFRLICLQILLCRLFRIPAADSLRQFWQIRIGRIIKNCRVKIHKQPHLLQKIPTHLPEICNLMNLICDVVENHPVIGFLNMQRFRLQTKKDVLRSNPVKRLCSTNIVLSYHVVPQLSRKFYHEASGICVSCVSVPCIASCSHAIPFSVASQLTNTVSASFGWASCRTAAYISHVSA